MSKKEIIKQKMFDFILNVCDEIDNEKLEKLTIDFELSRRRYKLTFTKTKNKKNEDIIIVDLYKR